MNFAKTRIALWGKVALQLGHFDGTAVDSP